MNYYGRFYRSALYPLLDRINTYLLRWIQKKYRVGTKQALRRLGPRPYRAPEVLRSLDLGGPGRGEAQNDESRMTGDCHVRFRGSPGVKFPGCPDY
ncbi:group II intron maturase-specific domain-containing protein [Streptomyces lasalocidi]